MEIDLEEAIKEIAKLRTECFSHLTNLREINQNLKTYLARITKREVLRLIEGSQEYTRHDTWSCTEYLLHTLIQQVENKWDKLETDLLEQKEQSSHLYDKYKEYKEIATKTKESLSLAEDEFQSLL